MNVLVNKEAMYLKLSIIRETMGKKCALIFARRCGFHDEEELKDILGVNDLKEVENVN